MGQSMNSNPGCYGRRPPDLHFYRNSGWHFAHLTVLYLPVLLCGESYVPERCTQCQQGNCYHHTISETFIKSEIKETSIMQPIAICESSNLFWYKLTII